MNIEALRGRRVTVVEVGPARRAAERARPGFDAGQDRVCRSAERGAAARHRSLGICEPEVGAANGRRGRGLCRHHATRRHPVHGARAEPGRARSRAGGRRAGDRDLCGVIGNVQPEKHQPEHRRIARRLRGGVRSRAGERVARARIPVDGVRLSVRRRRCRLLESRICRSG